MDILMIPSVQAILSVAAISWVCSFSISLLALLFVSGFSLRHYMPEIKAVVGLVFLAMMTVHLSTGHWLLF
jgi:uncharacterized membrane protein